MDRTNTPELLASEEIYEALEKAALFGGKLTQPTLDGAVCAEVKTIGLYDGKVTFKLMEHISLNPEVHIVFDFSYRDISFKLDARGFSFNGIEISAPIPEAVKGIPRRAKKRYALPLNNQSITLSQRIEKRGASGELKSNLLDASEKGLGLLFCDVETDSVLVNDHLWIKEVNGIPLEKPIFGTVVYASERMYSDGRRDVKAGLSLETSLPEEVLAEIRKLSNLTLTT